MSKSRGDALRSHLNLHLEHGPQGPTVHPAPPTLMRLKITGKTLKGTKAMEQLKLPQFTMDEI